MFVVTLFMAGEQKQRRRGAAFAVVVPASGRSVARVSLNRCEQRLFDYLHGRKEERQFWEEKLHALAKISRDPHAVVARLEPELWRYYLERSEVAAPFQEAVRHEGRQRVSMKNLAELLLRLWQPQLLKTPPVRTS